MIKLNEVTWYSKLAAIMFFLGIFPLLAFYLGMQYGIVLEQQVASERMYSMISIPISTVQNNTTIPYIMVPTNDPAYNYPQISSFSDMTVAVMVNETLEDAFGQGGCGVDDLEDAYEWNVTTVVDYAENNIFSVHASGNYFCGGASPTNNYAVTLTFDMTSGEVVAFSDLFESYETDQEQIFETIYAAQLTLAEMSAGVTEAGSCATVNDMQTLLNYPHDYRLKTNSQEVLVRPQYPHVIAACAETVAIPVEALLPFSPEDSILYRL